MDLKVQEKVACSSESAEQMSLILYSSSAFAGRWTTVGGQVHLDGEEDDSLMFSKQCSHSGKTRVLTVDLEAAFG